MITLIWTIWRNNQKLQLQQRRCHRRWRQRPARPLRVNQHEEDALQRHHKNASVFGSNLLMHRLVRKRRVPNPRIKLMSMKIWIRVVKTKNQIYPPAEQQPDANERVPRRSQPRRQRNERKMAASECRVILHNSFSVVLRRLKRHRRIAPVANRRLSPILCR